MLFFDELVVVGLIASAGLYWQLPRPWREPYLFAGSLVALAFVQPVPTLVILWGTVIVYGAARRIAAGRSWPFWGAVALVVTFLISGKYAPSILVRLVDESSPLTGRLIVPLGVSYLSFKLLALLIDAKRGVVREPRLLATLNLVFFLPTFPAGPIERYQTFHDGGDDTFDWRMIGYGLRRILTGYVKKVWLGNLVLHYVVYEQLRERALDASFSVVGSPVVVFAFLLGALIYAYVDLSSYADIAIGYSKLFGFDIMENMKWPILQPNLAAYWSCWHISLSSWCRNNVYFPVLGSTRNSYVAIYSSFITMGLWHNLSLNWLLWGIWHASGVQVYSYWSRFKKKKLKRVTKAVPPRLGYATGVALTISYSALGFAFITMDEMSGAGASVVGALQLLGRVVGLGW